MSTGDAPLPNAHPRGENSNEGEVPSRRTITPTVLIVDDNVDAVRMLEILLKHDGYLVAGAHNGVDGLRIAEELRPMCVLLDVGLPGLNGLEVALRLRRIESCQDLMIIGITGYGQSSDQCRSAEAGFDYHLLKPVEYEVLSALLSKAKKRWSENI